MPIITRQGWPLSADLSCEICDCKWTLDVGDLACVAVDPIDKVIRADAPCPSCQTLYTATKAIGSVRAPLWTMAKTQYNHIDPSERITEAIGLIEETVREATA